MIWDLKIVKVGSLTDSEQGVNKDVVVRRRYPAAGVALASILRFVCLLFKGRYL